jgi:sortase B
VYQVFGAVPYDNSHILYYHDFDDQLSYRKFINTIYSTTGIDATLVEDLKPQYGDKLLILSTCLWGDKNNRYLVLAKELTE